MILSILICSLNERINYLSSLLQILNPQLLGINDVELLILTDNENMSIGEKRNRLKKMAKGKYIVYIDDDDLISNDYVREIYRACLKEKDCVVFNESRIDINKNEYVLKYRLNINRDVEHRYEKYPNSRCVIKKEIADKFDFKNISMDEDDSWGLMLKPYLLTESVIDKVLYFYRLNPYLSRSKVIPEL